MSVKCTRDKQNEDSSFSILVYPRVPELLYRARQQPARRRRRRLARHTRLLLWPAAPTRHIPISIAASTVVAQLRRDVRRHRHAGRTHRGSPERRRGCGWRPARQRRRSGTLRAWCETARMDGREEKRFGVLGKGAGAGWPGRLSVSRTSYTVKNHQLEISN